MADQKPVGSLPPAHGKRFAIVVSRWHSHITHALASSAAEVLKGRGAEVKIVHVPGTWEIPIALQACLRKGCDGAIAFGCILQGVTSHADLIAGEVTRALMSLMLEHQTPICHGILTPRTEQEGLERAGLVEGAAGNRGTEAAEALLEVVAAIEAGS